MASGKFWQFCRVGKIGWLCPPGGSTTMPLILAASRRWTSVAGTPKGEGVSTW